MEEMEKKEQKPKKMKPYTRKWDQMARELAFTYCPQIYPCQHCGAPVINGYCCTNCQSGTPLLGGGTNEDATSN